MLKAGRRGGIATALAVVCCLVQVPGSTETAVSFRLAGCDYIEGIAKVPAEVVAPLVPPDFSVLAQGGLATVNMGGADCREATSGDLSGPAAFGWVLVRIEEPADPGLRGIGVRVWFYRLEHFVVPGDVYQITAAAIGADQTPVDAIDATVPAALSELVIRSGDSTHRVQVPLSAPDVGLGVASVRWREFHAVAGGYAMLQATLQPDVHAASLVGVMQPASGSLASDVLGPSSAGQAVFGTGYALEDAFMDVLPAP